MSEMNKSKVGPLLRTLLAEKSAEELRAGLTHPKRAHLRDVPNEIVAPPARAAWVEDNPGIVMEAYILEPTISRYKPAFSVKGRVFRRPKNRVGFMIVDSTPTFTCSSCEMFRSGVLHSLERNAMQQLPSRLKVWKLAV